MSGPIQFKPGHLVGYQKSLFSEEEVPVYIIGRQLRYYHRHLSRLSISQPRMHELADKFLGQPTGTFLKVLNGELTISHSTWKKVLDHLREDVV